MPIEKDIPALRRKLEEQLNIDMAGALDALKAELPEGSEKYNQANALIGRLNDANKERNNNTIDLEEYYRWCSKIRVDFLALLSELEAPDFDPEAAKAGHSDDRPKIKTGSVLYGVPAVMPLNKLTRCIVRIAIDEKVIRDHINFEGRVEVESQVEVSDVMSAELVDIEGSTFKITALNARAQRVRDTGYTEWLFGVTPLLEGEHQLLIKVSIMEIVPGFAEPVPRDVSFFETVTILTQAPLPEAGQEPQMKAAGLALAFAGDNQAKGVAEPARAAAPAPPAQAIAGNLRKLLAFFAVAAVVTIAAIVLGPSLKNRFFPPAPPDEKPPVETPVSNNGNPAGGPAVSQNPPQDGAPTTAAPNGKDSTGNQPAPNPSSPTLPKKPAAVNPPAPKPGPARVDVKSRRSGFDMLTVEGGKYEMGQRDTSLGGTGFSKDECPHSVQVSTFRMGKYEVTQADWQEVMGENPSHHTDCPDCPVENVSWNDVQAFIKKANEKYRMNYRLPTEEEWEYAARGGTRSKGYLYAGSNTLYNVATFSGETHPVGSSKANELGLYDMSGNVYEWCADIYKPYPGCAGETHDTRRVLRGGSWRDAPEKCRTTNRIHGATSSPVIDFGFRLARD